MVPPIEIAVVYPWYVTRTFFTSALPVIVDVGHLIDPVMIYYPPPIDAIRGAFSCPRTLEADDAPRVRQVVIEEP